MSPKRRKRYMPPFDVDITHLAKKGVGVGEAPDGSPVWVKPAPPGARMHVAPTGKRKGKWQARRLAMVEKRAQWAEPPCALFGVCGGCVLQQLQLAAQRHEKHLYALREIAEHKGWSLDELQQHVRVHEVRGAEDAYGYRNKIELSFGPKRYLSQEAFDAGELIDGRFLGFHAAGRFDRIADLEKCWLASDGMNALIDVAREHVLQEGQPVPWDPHQHKGFWRHMMLRQGTATGELLVVLYTASAKQADEVSAVQSLAEALMAASTPEGTSVVGVLWMENDDIADVARGQLRQVWGRDWFEEHLGKTKYRLSYRSFFQTSTKAAEILYDTIGEALGDAGGTLYDLYCGIGSIGLYLSDQFDAIVGIEEIPEAIEDAGKNAAANGITSVTYTAAKVEDALDMLPSEGEALALVVDPPRAGLHPKVAKALAQAPGDTLVYVACHPGSLGRDLVLLEEGGWEMTELWTVDLFPQTGHIEAVGRFVRKK
ncbi:MAG TPA: 23S rRNA (uracil(1939)-C(5))-methyltransferase RlmD [Myxococcales bacterium]|nr:23S rRNA (uracil(1939)-C(5))-methyltransferase RlmD [Myxococcales bacterium]